MLPYLAELLPVALIQFRVMPAASRFPPPWTIEEHAESFNGQRRDRRLAFFNEFDRTFKVMFPIMATALVAMVSHLR
jgi:hypothetical protein